MSKDERLDLGMVACGFQDVDMGLGETERRKFCWRGVEEDEEDDAVFESFENVAAMLLTEEAMGERLGLN